MKIIRTLLIAASALVLVNIAQAQTAATTDASVAVTSNANAPYSSDPYVQKRQADSIAKAEYKARKKAAKKAMKVEKKEAKSEMKEEKAEAKQTRKDTLAVEAAVTATTKVDPTK
jgi:hypothetical protein